MIVLRPYLRKAALSASFDLCRAAIAAWLNCGLARGVRAIVRQGKAEAAELATPGAAPLCVAYCCARLGG
jgi:hypothetical protein